jgi:dipeptidase E
LTGVERRRIVAMGGGGFSASPGGDPALDRYVLEVAERPNPRICLLPTASGDPEEQIQRFYRAYHDLPCEPTHLSLFRLGTKPVDLRAVLLGQDVIYAGGGSLLNLLAIWRAHGLDELLVAAWRSGTVLAGLSAGAMCWFEAGVTRSSGAPEPLAGLGLLEGSLTVHAEGEPERLPVWLAGIRDGTLPGGWALDDGVGLLFAGLNMQRAVSSRPGAGAQRVDQVAGELVRTRLEPELLGAGETAALGGFDEAVHELRRVRRMRRGLG